MTIADWLMIAAVLLGPIIAVQLTRHLDNKKEERERKLEVFKTLMATRAYTVSWDHVVALNRIESISSSTKAIIMKKRLSKRGKNIWICFVIKVLLLSNGVLGASIFL